MKLKLKCDSHNTLIVWCSVFTVGLEGHKLYCSSSWFFGISSAERSWKSPETLVFHLSGNPEYSGASVYVPTELWHRQEGHPTCKQSHICNSQHFFFPKMFGGSAWPGVISTHINRLNKHLSQQQKQQEDVATVAMYQCFSCYCSVTIVQVAVLSVSQGTNCCSLRSLPVVTSCTRGRTLVPRLCTPHAAAQLQPIRALHLRHTARLASWIFIIDRQRLALLAIIVSSI